MTNIWKTGQMVSNWLEANEIKASPLAILSLTNIILQAIQIVREDAYQQGQANARKEIDECKQH